MEEIDLLKRNLVGVEKAWRDNDSQAVYDAYQNLAKHFVIYSNTKRALFFYTKCLELAVNSDYLEGELEANLNLGLCHEKLGDILEGLIFLAFSICTDYNLLFAGCDAPR